MESHTTQLIAVPEAEIRIHNTSYSIRSCFSFLFSEKKERGLRSYSLSLFLLAEINLPLFPFSPYRPFNFQHLKIVLNVVIDSYSDEP
jgi:hypothetical protein